MTSKQIVELLTVLKVRFEKNSHRHKGIEWENINQRLEANPAKCWSLNQMEETGGEPAVLDYDKKTGEYVFYDCAPESPAGRRSLCYDRAAWEARKVAKPANNAMDVAADMGIEMLNEAQYQFLQGFGPFDQKTSSWLKTPEEIRKKDGAIFGDYRFGRVFIYHNGVQSYYAGRGFRGLLKV